MKWFPSFGFQRRKRELQEEIDAHLQMAIADRVARGETAEAARQAAKREFGNIPLVQEVTRDMWGQALLEQLSRDVRYALRQLRKSPGFAITATAMLAVAICANSTVFTFANVYFVHHLGLSLQKVGFVFSLSQLVQFVAVLGAPLLFRRTGLVRGVVL